MDALEDRNLTTHTYRETTVQLIVQNMKSDYFPMLQSLHFSFASKVATYRRKTQPSRKAV